MLTNELVV